MHVVFVLAMIQCFNEVTFHKTPLMEIVSLQELNHCNSRKLRVSSGSFLELCSCSSRCLWSFCYQLLSMATHIGTEAETRGRERVEGWGRRAHAWACYPLHEQVKDTGDGLACQQFIYV